MYTQITNVIQAFPNTKQYAIPSYQRNYVWTREGQWEPLWEDVKTLAVRSLKEGQEVKSHFLGTIITKPVGARNFINLWWVVDGQQRLTTLQVMLAAAHAAFAEFDLHQFADILSDSLVNSDAMRTDAKDKYKIDPKSGDYGSFASIVDAALSARQPSHTESRLAECYSYFHRTVREWLESPGEAPIEKYANALTMAVREKLRVVDIQLGKGDNPHTIFEALNARGEPLTEWEKTKNYILSIATGPDDPDGDGTYKAHLEPYDTEPYWNEVVSVARFTGKRIDLFLSYFAQIELPGRRRKVSGDPKLRPLRRDSLYREFRYVGEHYYRHDSKELRAMLERFKHYAAIYRRINRQEGFSAYALRVMRRRHVLNLNSFVPIFMELVSKLGSGSELDRVLQIVDSYLMRRVAVKATYSGFDDIAFGHVQALREAAPADIGTVLASRFLASGRSDRWPREREVVQHFLTGNMYRGISSARLKLLLGGIAEEMHEEKRPKLATPFGLESSVSVEHVAPQGWERHWQGDLEVGTSEEDRWRVSQVVQRIGNLTLVTQPMNSSLGAQPWSFKADLLKEDNLEMNRRLLSDMEGDVWNESEIDRRGRQLAEYVNKIWPDAEVLANQMALDISVPDLDPAFAAHARGPSTGALTARQKNAERYGRFWSHYAERYPEDGLKAKYRQSNQWIRRGSGNPDLSLMFASNSVGIFFTRWGRAEEGKKAWLEGRRAIIDRLVGAGKPPDEFQSFDTHNEENWDAVCDWFHERLDHFLTILEAEPEQVEA